MASVDDFSVHDFSATTITGKAQNLSAYADKVMVIVNVASKCGFTPQYDGLETLYREYRDHGFVVLGFPCNQFGAQEPGSAQEIADFCATKYAVTFPMFAKIDVNGANAHPLFDHLKKARPGFTGIGRVKWNFTKFLVDQTGKVITRYGPHERPRVIKHRIRKLLSS